MRANLSIKQRIVLGFTLMIALVLLASGTGLLYTMSVQRTITVISNGSRLTGTITNLQVSWLAVVATVDNMLLTRQKSLIERQLNRELSAFQQQLNTLQSYSWKDNPQTSMQHKRFADNLKDLGIELKNVTDELATLALNGRWARAQYLRHNDLASLQSRMVENMDNLSMNVRRDVETSVVESVNDQNRIRTYWFVITLAAIGLGFLAGLLTIKSIIRPIAKLVYTARAVRDGDLSGTAEVLRDDEIGVLSNVFNSMTARLRDLIGSLEHEIEDHIQAENERSRLENELLQAQKMEAIGSLAGGVAHDFNNLLTAILGNAELALSSLRRDEGSNQKIIHEIQEIQHAAERASALTRQLLMFSRKEAIKSQVLDLNSTITGMQNMLRRLIPENIRIEYSCQRDISPVSADARQIEQVILNLAVNARDSMPEGGRLKISTIST
ncbi:MAG TPA: HAMP domain-containing protein, partial [Deltaproteobacteria bacterium]|nr:HAMP domain-containing protein [Deltaproteobacteria bacterium]